MASENAENGEGASLVGIKNMALRRKEELKKEIEFLTGELKKVEGVLSITDSKRVAQESLKDSLKDDRIGLPILNIFADRRNRRISNEQNLSSQEVKAMLEENYGISVSRATIYKKLNFLEKMEGILKIKQNLWTLNV